MIDLGDNCISRCSILRASITLKRGEMVVYLEETIRENPTLAFSYSNFSTIYCKAKVIRKGE